MTDKNAMANPILKIPPELREKMLSAVNAGARELFRVYMPRVLNQASKIEGQIDRAAKKQGIDPKYVRWILGRPNLWGTTPHRKALLIAGDILTKAGVIVPYGVMSIPPGEGMGTDFALLEVGEWATRKMVPALFADYRKSLAPLARKHATALALGGDPAPGVVQAAGKISEYMKYLLTERRIGSPNGFLVLSVLGLIL